MDKEIVVVFGSSRPQDGSEEYSESRKLGSMLADAGFIVSTGAYRGVMEAVSRGASETGGHVIGVSCDQIENMVPGLQVNQWVTEEIRYSDLRGRLHHLVEKCSAMIAMPGGIGTLLEIAYAWGFMQCEEISRKPLIVVGKTWFDVVNTVVEQDNYVEESHKMLIHAVDSVEKSLKVLKKLDKT
ncbi:MAG TPA: hypothetical protein DCL76_03920 [Chloroflexi bacterium]|nr:hypothetical protein [Chloroflexota bacterium]|tara:strand:- start:2378 stop:2929 length:552 start_codon:yes stop_codon:yes gene_type:complete